MFSSRLAVLAPAVPLTVVLAVLATDTRAPLTAVEPRSNWQSQWGGFNSVVDIVPLSSTDVWAVGSNIIRYDGHTWSSAGSQPYPLHLAALDLATPTEGWAVGSDTAIPFRGGQWREPEALRAGVNLFDVAMVAPDRGWAVGQAAPDRHGIIYHFDGSQWREAASVDAPVSPLYSISMLSDSAGWAVGRQGSIYRFDGNAWQALAPVVQEDLLGVFAVAHDDVWAVGGQYLSAPRSRVILHYDGERWQVVLSEEGLALFDIAIRDGQGWAVGQRGKHLFFDGEKWHDRGRTDIGHRELGLVTVAFVPGTDYALAGSDQGGVVRLDAAGWQETHGERWLRGISMLSPEDGWVVSRFGPALRFDGERWNRVSSPPELAELNDVSGLAPDDVWAVGHQGLIMHYDGVAWSRVDSPTNLPLRRVRMYSPDHGWAIGTKLPVAPSTIFESTVLHYDGDEWRVVWDVSGGNEFDFDDVDALGADDVWIAAGLRFWHFDGVEWSAFPVAESVSSIDMISPTEGWAGGGGMLYQYDGQQWRRSTAVPEFGFPAQIEAVQMADDGTGWAVGWYGYVLYCDGRLWHFVRAVEDPAASYASPFALFGVAALEAGGRNLVWAVGAPESILHWQGDGLTSPPTITPAPTRPTQKPPPTPPPTPPTPLGFDIYIPKADKQP